MPEIAFLNGQFLPIDEAKVSVNDRGYQFGDGVYEVIRSYDGRLWALERHLGRLKRSLAEINITGISIDEVRESIQATCEKSGLSSMLVYVQITRGVCPRKHNYPEGLEPVLLITVREFQERPPELFTEGVRALTYPDIRWLRRDIKSTNLLPNILARQRAVSSGVYEAILVQQDGTVTEGAATNVFAVIEGVLRTHPLSPRILPGVTRGLVIETAREIGIAVEERAFSRNEMFAADEVFLSGTGDEVLGIIEIDGKEIADGKVRPRTKALRHGYLKRVAEGRDA
jgi:D-alanine transaminase